MASMADVEKGQVEAVSPRQGLENHYGPMNNNGSGNGTGLNFQRGSSRIANPGSLGLFSFASTTFILSMYNVQTRGIHEANVVVGMALFAGGLAQLLAGMWEYPRGNTFGATAFSSYGAFWLSYATILLPSSGIIAAYPSSKELDAAIGIFLVAWMMVTFFLFIAALRKNIGFILLFGFLTVTFMLLAVGKFTEKTSVTTAGGALGIITAFIAYYIGLSELLAAETASIGRLPLGLFKHE